MDNKIKLYADKLRSSNLRPTKQRLKISQYLFDREKTFHFTVEDLGKVFNSKNINNQISLATLYNTVHAFKKAGHLKEILTSNNTSYYDTNINMHHHFYDDDTNELTDINFNEIELTKLPHAPKGKKIKACEVIINLTKI